MASNSICNGWFKTNSGTEHKGREWSLKLSAARIDIGNFTSGGWAQFLPGMKSGELSARVFWDTVNQFTLGDVLNTNLGIGYGYYLLFNATLLDMSLSTAVDKAGEAQLTLMTNGSFTTTFST